MDQSYTYNSGLVEKRSSCHCYPQKNLEENKSQPESESKQESISESESTSKQETVKSNNDDLLKQLEDELQDKIRKLDEKDDKIKELYSLLDNERQQWQSQQRQMVKICKDCTKAKGTLSKHNIYCASLGATMGGIIWKMTCQAMAARSMIEDDRVSLFFKLMDDSLNTFLKVFKGDLPENDSVEYQFLLSWIGILTNISASSKGRFYLCTKPDGMPLLKDIITLLPNCKKPNGEILKHMVLMVIHNVMINKIGLRLMQNNTNLVPTLTEAIASRFGKNVLLLTLDVINMLTTDIPSKQYMTHLSNKLKFTGLKEIAKDANVDIEKISQHILKHLLEASTLYDVFIDTADLKKVTG